MKKNKKLMRVVLWVLIVFMVAGMVLPAIMFHSFADAQGCDFTVSATTSTVESGQDETKLNFKITNNTNAKKEKVQIKIVDAENTRVLSGSSDSVTIPSHESKTLSIPISTYHIDGGWEYWYKVKLYVNEQETTNNLFSSSKIKSSTEGKYNVYVYDSEKRENDSNPGDSDNTKQYNGKIRLSLEVPQGGVSGGNKNKVTIKAKNIGNSALMDMKIGFTSLPDGVTLPNQTLRKSVDTATINVEKTATFYLEVKDDVKTGNYPIVLFAEGKLPNGSVFSTEETVHLHIVGTNKSKERGDISIRNVRLPERAKAGESFNLSFDVVNTGSGKLEGLKISVEGTDGIVNKSKGIFIEDTLLPKQTKKYNVTFFSNSKTEPKNYPIKIAVEPLETKEGEGTIATSQYAGIFIYGGGENADKQGGIKNPQIMIEDYSYGGTDVQAGKEFVLHLTLANTSTKTLRNIKVSLSADEGTFVPVNSSSSFFIDSMGAKSQIKKAMRFVAKPTAEQKTSGISVDYSYEDLQGNVLTAKDTISIPVVQKTKLDIGEVNIPTEGVFEGQQANFSVTFYNLGKTVLSNLNVKATGDFTIEDKNGYFVGNMEAGKSDSFDFTVIPDKVGTANGEIIFSFEDVSGTMQEVRKEFQFEVSEFIPPTDPSDMPEENQDTHKGKKIAGVSVLVILLAGAGIWKKKKNRSKAKELEIDE